MLRVSGADAALVGQLAFQMPRLRPILERSLADNNFELLPYFVIVEYTAFVIDRPDLWGSYVKILDDALEVEYNGFLSIVSFGLVQKVDPFSVVGGGLSALYGSSLRSAEAGVWGYRYPDRWSALYPEESP